MDRFKIGDVVQVVRTSHSIRKGAIVTIMGKSNYEYIVEYPFPIGTTVKGFKENHTCFGHPTCYKAIDLITIEGTIDLIIFKNLFRVNKNLYVKHNFTKSLAVNDVVTLQGTLNKGKFNAAIVIKK